MAQPNPDMDKEQAEGERETVEQALGEQEPQQGVTNRPASEEQEEQADLPPRGEAKKPSPGGDA
jgi:hypothetical protein